MMLLLQEIRQNPILWLLAVVPVLFALVFSKSQAHTLLFVLSIAAIVPLAALLSRATECVAAKTGDTIGGLLNATLGNLTELLITVAALRAGQYVLVKASLAGVIVCKTLFLLGMCFLVGGLRHHVQLFNRDNARLQAGMLFVATIALLAPTLATDAPSQSAPDFIVTLSLCISVVLITTYVLGLIFALKSHRDLFASVSHGDVGEDSWPLSLALIVLAVATIVVALVSDVFVESLQHASQTLGIAPAFVGFIIVALVGGVPELAAALTGARKDRLDLSIGIGLGGASQMALFAAPFLVFLSYLVAPTPMDLLFWPGAVAMILIATTIACLVTSSGRSAWFLGVLLIMVYLIFAVTLYVVPPHAH